MNARRVLLLCARFALGGVFVIAGALKIADPTGFATAITHYQLLPEWAPLLAAMLPTIEIVGGAALLAGPLPWRRAGALCLGALMILFMVAAASALARGVDVACGCFGSASGAVSAWTLVRDGALLAAAALTLAWDRSRD
jgi:uncharacterized membrane protein YphA (DoxX/SURF4 family)